MTDFNHYILKCMAEGGSVAAAFIIRPNENFPYNPTQPNFLDQKLDFECDKKEVKII